MIAKNADMLIDMIQKIKRKVGTGKSMWDADAVDV